MLPTAPLLVALLLLTGCAATPTQAPGQVPPPSAPTEPSAPLDYARMRETISVGGPKVTPLAMLEDSRCPLDTQCVWAGRVRIQVRVDLGSGSTTRELTQGEPIHVADGSLELVEVKPDPPMAGEAKPAPADYRFGLRFMGGI